MLGQRHRRWPNINPTLGQRPVFAGIAEPNAGSMFAKCPERRPNAQLAWGLLPGVTL